MSNLYIIFCLVNVIATQIHASPAKKAETVNDVVTRNFSKKCPNFSQNILANNTLDCKDLILTNLPKKLTMLNINIFYCVGMMIADLELCNTHLHDDKYLPKNSEELNGEIVQVRRINVSIVCKELKNMKLFSTPNIIPKELIETVNELKEKLSGPFCSKLCTDLTGDNLNDMCAMMYYLNSHMGNVTKIVDITTKQFEQETETKPVIISPHKQQEQQKPDVKQHDFPLNKYNQQTLDVNKVEQLKPKLDNLPAVGSEQELVKQKPISRAQLTNSEITLHPEIKVEEKPATPPAEKKKPQLQTHIKVQEVEKSNVNKTTVEAKVENQKPKQLTNEATNDNFEIKLEKHDFTSAEEKEYSTTSTTNYDKNDIQSMDKFDTDSDINIENEDIDEEDINKWNKETLETQNRKGNIVNHRIDINPNSNKQVNEDIEESNFFSYFMFISVMFIAGYVVYHNKQKIMALLLEGRRDRNSRRRPSTSSYRKLNSNLEEAVTSKCSGSASHVIY